MRKYTKPAFVICFVIALISQTAIAQRQPRLSSYNLRNTVKSVTSVTEYEGANDMNYQEDFLFDTAGNLTTYKKKGFGNTHVINYPTEEKRDSLQRAKYDRDGDIVERISTTPDGTPKHSTHYVYSAPHEMCMTIDYEYTEEGVIENRTLTEYNKQRRIVSVHKYTPDEALLLEEHYTYDKYGNLVKKLQIFYDDIALTQTKTTELRKYKYDRYGNWYEQKYTLNGVKRYSIKRSIEYYKVR